MMSVTRIDSKLLALQILLLALVSTVAAVDETLGTNHDVDSKQEKKNRMMKNMNGLYKVANSDSFDTDYYHRKGKSETEFFDIYSLPIRSYYGMVHWTSHGVRPLPQHIIERFEDPNNSVMAIVGYEVDQIVWDPTRSEEDQPQDEISVPITSAYNHHYGVNLMNDKATQLESLPSVSLPRSLKHTMSHDGNGQAWHVQTKTSVVASQQEVEIPYSQFISEANGGEMRKSYHGYPSGYAQLIESPNAMLMIPMQIDTWNRNKNTTAPLLPHSATIPTTIPPGASYSPLLECPCTDRVNKTWSVTYTLKGGEEGACVASIANATECFAAGPQVIPALDIQTRVNEEAPPGCSVALQSNGTLTVLWNNKKTDHLEQEQEQQEYSRDNDEGGTIRVGVRSSATKIAFEEKGKQHSSSVTASNDDRDSRVGVIQGMVNATIRLETSDATLTLVGPADRWFGLGFGTSTMCLHPQADACPQGGPYALIILRNNTIQERKLEDHGKGRLLEPTITVQSNKIDPSSGLRTVVLIRLLEGRTHDYFTFDKTQLSSVPMIMAVGCPPTNDAEASSFGQHCHHGATQISFVPMSQSQSICNAGIAGTIGGQRFVNEGRCAPYPTSSLGHNPTCGIETYQGGLACCVHDEYLLDRNQTSPWPDQPLDYRLKFRFYFEDYVPAPSTLTSSTSLAMPSQRRQDASHRNLVRLYWMTESFAGEYDIPKCQPGTPASQCIFEISSRFQAVNLLHNCSVHEGSGCTGIGSTDPAITKGVELIYAGPHCHAPSCLSMELYNADTGELLCQATPIHGQGSTSTSKFDEKGFLAIPPCLWGDEKGLTPPILLPLETNLLSVKRSNNTFPHTGDMASWQMRGVIVPHE